MQLDEIIHWAQSNNSRLGYFPALYRKVTIGVKQGIADNFFDDGRRMERLDVLFANRYLAAFEAYQAGTQVTNAWRVAFNASRDWSAIVLQHLLLGINTHINVDLGVAAAQVAPGDTIHSLQGDFDKINRILASLVTTVENTLTKIWPMLKLLNWIAGKNDEAIINFSITIARDEAWKVACKLAYLDETSAAQEIASLDEEIARLGHSIQHPGPIVGSVTNCIRLGERSSVSEIISLLESD